jgi:hypothetical protein
VVTDDRQMVLQSVYPNPSRDYFNFRLLLTGPALPEDFSLQIYSAMGGVIRSFGNETLGVLHVGSNEISIPATDANGNPLSAGIYVFRIAATIEGKQFTASGRLMVAR